MGKNIILLFIVAVLLSACTLEQQRAYDGLIDTLNAMQRAEDQRRIERQIMLDRLNRQFDRDEMLYHLRNIDNSLNSPFRW